MMNVAIITDNFLPEANRVAEKLGRWVQYLQERDINSQVFALESKVPAFLGYITC